MSQIPIVVDVLHQLAQAAKLGQRVNLTIHAPDDEVRALVAQVLEAVPMAWHAYPDEDLPAGWLTAELVLPGGREATLSVHRLEQPAGWTSEPIELYEQRSLEAGHRLAALYREALLRGALISTAQAEADRLATELLETRLKAAS